MLCVPLFVDDRTLGTLSLYADRPGAFRDGAEPVARLLAAVSAIALADSQHRARMERALHNRDLIGQAKGILMYRHGVGADEAFEMLRTRSQRTNSKLLALAERVVETGSLD
jgi:AmiR/NasT family two-component response regulator